MSVVADSAEVEILIFKASEVAFFPEDVQRDIIIGLQSSNSIERPYSEEDLQNMKNKFNNWDAGKLNILLKALRK